MMFGRNERGTTAILVAVALLMLMGFASLAIDAGLGFDDRRGTQNAADLAALAAAWQDCNPASGGGSPTTVARATAADNGYDHTSPDVQVLVTNPSANTWTVQIQNTNDSTFGQATPYAPDQLDILSEATAVCTEVGLLGGFAVFGQSSTCGDSVDLSGSNINIVGGVHSNQDVKISGSGPVVSGESTYRRNDQTAASVTATEYFGSALNYPLNLTIAEYRPAGARATGAYYDLPGNDITAALMVSEGYATSAPPWLEINTPGIYYANRDISFNRIRLTGAAAAQGVTFVAERNIDLGTTEDLTGFDPLATGSGPPVMVFANGGSPTCNPPVVKISGSDVAWEGIIFAPNGKIDISASGISSLNGSIIGYSVGVSGANLTVTYEDDPNSDPDFRVELVD